MTEHVHLRVRTQDGFTAIVNPTDEEDFDIQVIGVVYGAQITEAEEEKALDLLHKVACRIRAQTFKRLNQIRAERNK